MQNEIADTGASTVPDSGGIIIDESREVAHVSIEYHNSPHTLSGGREGLLICYMMRDTDYINKTLKAGVNKKYLSNPHCAYIFQKLIEASINQVVIDRSHVEISLQSSKLKLSNQDRLNILEQYDHYSACSTHANDNTQFLFVLAQFWTIYPELKEPHNLDLIDGKHEIGTDDFILHEKTIAQLFVKTRGDLYRYNTDSDNWLIWNKKRWEMDKIDTIGNRLSHLCDQLLQWCELSRPLGDDKAELDRWKKRYNFIMQSSNSDNIKRILRTLRLEDGINTTHERYDQNLNLINAQNLTYDCDMYKGREFNKLDYLTQIMNVEYDCNAQCPKWNAMLEKVFRGDREVIDYFQKAIGKSLSGDTDDSAIYILYGDGLNGKSTLMNVIKAIMGDYGIVLGFNVLLDSKTQGEKYALASLHNKRFVYFSEVKRGTIFDEGIIKQITNKEIPVRQIYQKTQWIRNIGTKFLDCNHLPKITASDLGTTRRIVIIPFSYQFSKDEVIPNYEDELIAEGSGILNWMIEGLRRYRTEGMETPRVIAEAAQEYHEDCSVFERWCRDCISIDGDNSGWISVNQLYVKFRQYCNSHNETEWKENTFAKEMKRKYSGLFQKRKSGNGYCINCEGIAGRSPFPASPRKVLPFPDQQSLEEQLNNLL